MTYVEKLAQLVYYLLVGALAGFAFYLVSPVAVRGISWLKESGAWVSVVAYGAVVLLVLFACLVTWLVFDLPHRARVAAGRPRSRWAMLVGVAVIAVLVTYAGYDDSGWSGVGNAWGMAAILVVFWGLLGGIVILVFQVIKASQRVFSHFSRSGPHT